MSALWRFSPIALLVEKQLSLQEGVSSVVRVTGFHLWPPCCQLCDPGQVTYLSEPPGSHWETSPGARSPPSPHPGAQTSRLLSLLLRTQGRVQEELPSPLPSVPGSPKPTFASEFHDSVYLI